MDCNWEDVAERSLEPATPEQQLKCGRCVRRLRADLARSILKHHRAGSAKRRDGPQCLLVPSMMDSSDRPAVASWASTRASIAWSMARGVPSQSARVV